MLRKFVFAIALCAVAAPAAAQSPFETIHGDILRKNGDRAGAAHIGVQASPRAAAEAGPAPLRRRPLHDRRRDQSDHTGHSGKRQGEDHAGRGDARHRRARRGQRARDIGRAQSARRHARMDPSGRLRHDRPSLGRLPGRYDRHRGALQRKPGLGRRTRPLLLERRGLSAHLLSQRAVVGAGLVALQGLSR